jgi:hypothetical protein
VTNVLLPAWDDYQDTKTDVRSIDMQIASFETKKLQSEADHALIKKIDAQQSNIISCLNTRANCAQIDASLKNNFSTNQNRNQFAFHNFGSIRTQAFILQIN